MKEDKLLKLSQWATMMALLNLDVYDIWAEEDDSNYGDGDDGVLTTIRQIKRIEERQQHPDDLMRAALMTMEMGITEDDIGDYVDHLEQEKEAREQARRQETIDSHPTVKKLREEYKFALVESKQYKNHTHFEFETSEGTQVRARCKYHWTTGTDLHYKYRVNGKLVQHKFNFPHMRQIAGSLPEQYMNPREALAMTFALYLTFGRSPKGMRLIKP